MTNISMEQINLPIFTHLARSHSHKCERSGAFTYNMKLPIHRWFRYSAGFSAEWVLKTIKTFRPSAILDPFAGSATTLLVAEQENISSYGFEAHPFITRVAKAKLLWDISIDEFLRAADKVLQKALLLNSDIASEVQLILKCFTKDSLIKLCSLRDSYSIVRNEMPYAIGELIWLAITSILRPCSHVGTAQWQYVLPAKIKSRVMEPFTAFKAKINEMATDIQYFRHNALSSALLMEHDARLPLPQLNNNIDMVITSPPYPNNYDYGDSTRLEMCFWKEIKSWGEIQASVRRNLVHSCSQHVTAEKLKLNVIIKDAILSPVKEELEKICQALEKERMNHGGRKAYHIMIAAYFLDLVNVFTSLRQVCKSGSKLCFIIGDSAPYGIYVPVEDLLGRLAVSVGFKEFSYEKIRDRNIKWKNRKHSVPLKEGILWIEG